MSSETTHKCRDCQNAKPPNPKRRWRRIKATICKELTNLLSLPRRVDPDIERECTAFKKGKDGKA